MRLIGIDPGLRKTGWGVISVSGNQLSYISDGVVESDPDLTLAERLKQIHSGLHDVMREYNPDEAAVEETFVNKNPTSTLKLGQARGIALLVPAEFGVPVGEYPPNLVKKTVVGSGHAEKQQIQMMVRMLLPGCIIVASDAADALAVAICHAQHKRAPASVAVRETAS